MKAVEETALMRLQRSVEELKAGARRSEVSYSRDKARSKRPSLTVIKGGRDD